MNRQALSDIARKERIFSYVEEAGNITKTCRYFGISRETFYDWKRRYAASGDEGLINSSNDKPDLIPLSVSPVHSG